MNLHFLPDCTVWPLSLLQQFTLFRRSLLNIYSTEPVNSCTLPLLHHLPDCLHTYMALSLLYWWSTLSGSQINNTPVCQRPMQPHRAEHYSLTALCWTCVHVSCKPLKSWCQRNQSGCVTLKCIMYPGWFLLKKTSNKCTTDDIFDLNHKVLAVYFWKSPYNFTTNAAYSEPDFSVKCMTSSSSISCEPLQPAAVT